MYLNVFILQAAGQKEAGCEFPLLGGEADAASCPPPDTPQDIYITGHEDGETRENSCFTCTLCVSNILIGTKYLLKK